MVRELVLSQPEEKLTSRCAEGEWTIKEILVHMIDDERIYAYRTLRFARHDTTELSGFEQDASVAYSGANERGSEDILEEYPAVRMATIALFKSFDAETCTRSGVANGAR